MIFGCVLCTKYRLLTLEKACKLSDDYCQKIHKKFPQLLQGNTHCTDLIGTWPACDSHIFREGFSPLKQLEKCLFIKEWCSDWYGNALAGGTNLEGAGGARPAGCRSAAGDVKTHTLMGFPYGATGPYRVAAKDFNACTLM